MWTFDKMFEKLIIKEGGYSNDPYDSGGKTKYGITESTARKHGYKGDMKDLSLSYAKNIYYTEYYKNPRIIDIIDDELREEVFDTAVNCGIETAIRFLQESYNFMYDGVTTLGIDGIIGNKTLSAINGYNKPKRLVKFCNALQCENYLKIIRKNPKNKKFGFGWLDKRVVI